MLRTFFFHICSHLPLGLTDKNRIEVTLVPSSMHSRTLQLRLEQERLPAPGADAWSLDDFLILAFETEAGADDLQMQ